MADYADREHYIPIRRSDLVDLLCKDKDFPRHHEEPFRQFCRLVMAIYHFQYHDELEKLKKEYAPFDPDAVTYRLSNGLSDRSDQQLARLYERFNWLMERANFRRLTREELQRATESASEWGLNLDIDFAAFDHLEVYIRGDAIGKRLHRRWWRFWQLEEIKVPVYQRLVIILKQRKHRRLGPNPDTKNVFLKQFKVIPKADVEMLIPGGKLKMPRIAKGRLGASLVGSVGYVGFRVFQEFSQLWSGFLQANPLVFWGPLSLVAGYGYKQWAGYQGAKQTYSLQLTQSLYYQNLDSNVGVIHHLLDEAEEQECREAILGYYYLWRYANENGWSAQDLDDYVEMDLERLANLKVDFEIADAIDKLETLGIVEKVGDRLRAVPLDRALEMLDYQWDNYFQYNKVASSR